MRYWLARLLEMMSVSAMSEVDRRARSSSETAEVRASRCSRILSLMSTGFFAKLSCVVLSMTSYLLVQGV